MITIAPTPAVAPTAAERALWLTRTPLLDFDSPSVQSLAQGWRELPESERIGAAYRFVKDDLAFGYNVSDDLPASAVLRDGYGQCNTKSTVLMALLRALGVPCRFRGFTIDKRLQRGAVTGWAYWLETRLVIHSLARGSLPAAGGLHPGRQLPSRLAAALRRAPRRLLWLRRGHTGPAAPTGGVVR